MARNYTDGSTQKRNEATNIFENNFSRLLKNAFCGKSVENSRNRTKRKILKKNDDEQFMKKQSKPTFNGIRKPYTNCDSYTFRQNEVYMD